MSEHTKEPRAKCRGCGFEVGDNGACSYVYCSEPEIPRVESKQSEIDSLRAERDELQKRLDAMHRYSEHEKFLNELNEQVAKAKAGD